MDNATFTKAMVGLIERGWAEAMLKDESLTADQFEQVMAVPELADLVMVRMTERGRSFAKALGLDKGMPIQ